MLADLHPSLANDDHANTLIKKVRRVLYPDGTGFKGMFELFLWILSNL